MASLYLKHIYIVIIEGLNIALAFTMGTDTTTILSSPIGQPMATVRREAMIPPGWLTG